MNANLQEKQKDNQTTVESLKLQNQQYKEIAQMQLEEISSIKQTIIDQQSQIQQLTEINYDLKDKNFRLQEANELPKEDDHTSGSTILQTISTAFEKLPRIMRRKLPTSLTKTPKPTTQIPEYLQLHQQDLIQEFAKITLRYYRPSFFHLIQNEYSLYEHSFTIIGTDSKQKIKATQRFLCTLRGILDSAYHQFYLLETIPRFADFTYG
eukprot:TRINITY_DN43736_c0_g1_i1.p4 TRINITY_DN43736_c0_g1~~TRINITY_DN43736_c0_g1_i1.p4  ORF type:complete len:209 (-),score=17.11 TRINITY_DN43736_c0_g1_i1:599-1225(-)